MLDHRLLLEHPDEIKHALQRRSIAISTIDALIESAELRRRSLQKAESLRAQMNEASDRMKALAASGDQAAMTQARDSLKDLKNAIKEADFQSQEHETALQKELLTIPNIPHASVPDGHDESQNRIERHIGTPRTFEFEPKAHFDIGEALGMMSFEQGAKMSGARFVVLRHWGARLERALGQFMLDSASNFGYTEIAPPLLVRSDAMQNAGQYPKFIGESFETLDREYTLIPTSEVPLANLHSGDLLSEDQLPLRYTAYTPCFRREAGAAGRDTRGLIRLHQFSKVELFSYTTPDKSMDELERLVSNAGSILEDLGLPYRVVSLCTGDLSFTSTKTYDLEVWLPSVKAYREISSCSNCTDYQARRSSIRYRPLADASKSKTQFVHSLNGSALAVGRTMVALIENYQQADGSIQIPDVLVKYLGTDRIA